MKSTKLTTIIVFTFILTFALNVAAQKKPYKNEIDGYNFYASEKMKSIRVAKSTEEDVIKIFGSKCRNSCDYDSDWKIQFLYFSNIKVITQGIGSRQMQVNPKLLGKIMQISFIPKKKISFADHKFSRKFKKIKGKLESRKTNGLIDTTFYYSYVDKNGLAYQVFDSIYLDSTNEKAKNKKGDLLSIQYRITSRQARKMFVRKK